MDLISTMLDVGFDVILWDQDGPTKLEATRMTLEEHFAQVVQAVRSALADANIPSMEFSLSAEGRTMDGHLKVEVKLAEKWETSVVGRSVDATVAELLRRKGWAARNAPLELGHTSSPGEEAF